jgi:hypothetical protein
MLVAFFPFFVSMVAESHDIVLTVRVTASHDPTSIKGAHNDGAPAIATVNDAATVNESQIRLEDNQITSISGATFDVIKCK